MSATVPLRDTDLNDEPDVPTLEAPRELVEEYLELVQQRRAVEDRLAFVRSELEMLAVHALKDERPRARFAGSRGAIAVRLMPTCLFDRALVARELQRMGKLADIAILQGPGLARYLAREPLVAARLGGHIRHRKSIMLMATDG